MSGINTKEVRSINNLTFVILLLLFLSTGKAFKHEYTRDKHTKTVHREDREHMCPQCGTLFKAKSYLDQHLAHVHTTKERVMCK